MALKKKGTTVKIKIVKVEKGEPLPLSDYQLDALNSADTDEVKSKKNKS